MQLWTRKKLRARRVEQQKATTLESKEWKEMAVDSDKTSAAIDRALADCGTDHIDWSTTA